MVTERPVTLTAAPLHPLALDEQVFFALSVAARKVVAVCRPALEPMGLTHPHYLVMLALWGHAPASVRQLGATLQLDPGTPSPLLERRRMPPADVRVGQSWGLRPRISQ